MKKGAQTRQRIIDRAMTQASTLGLEGISIGKLAILMGISKSGLFAHFRSKENLQIAVLESAAALFNEHVVQPALLESRGEPRVRALFERWLLWASRDGLPGGCLFVTASIEFDDRPGPVREMLAETQKKLLSAISRAASIAVEEGHFRENLDPELFAYVTYSLMLGAHHYYRLLNVKESLSFARRAFEPLILSARGEAPTSKALANE